LKKTPAGGCLFGERFMVGFGHGLVDLDALDHMMAVIGL
jgi:hydrogenase/urease accessory protein HupE